MDHSSLSEGRFLFTTTITTPNTIVSKVGHPFQAPGSSGADEKDAAVKCPLGWEGRGLDRVAAFWGRQSQALVLTQVSLGPCVAGEHSIPQLAQFAYLWLGDPHGSFETH